MVVKQLYDFLKTTLANDKVYLGLASIEKGTEYIIISLLSSEKIETKGDISPFISSNISIQIVSENYQKCVEKYMEILKIVYTSNNRKKEFEKITFENGRDLESEEDIFRREMTVKIVSRL